MNINRNEKNNLEIELDEDSAIAILACLREVCFGVDLHAFDTRIGYSRDTVGALVQDLKKSLEEIGVSE